MLLRHKIVFMVGILCLLHQPVFATQIKWNPSACKVLNQGSVTIQKVSKIGVTQFDPNGSSNMMEISGTSSAGGPISIRFKVIRENCQNCSQVELNRIDSSNLCVDSARMAIAMKQPLQFMESGAGALCDVSPDNTNLKVYEVRDLAQGSTLLPPGTCALGTMPAVGEIVIPDETTLSTGK